MYIMKRNSHYLTEFYQKNYKKAVLFAQSFVLNLEQAEDIASDAILKLIEMGDVVNKEKNILALFHSIIRNKCLDYLRREQRWYKICDEIQSLSNSKTNDDDEICNKELNDSLQNLMSTLPQDTRNIFIAVRIQGKSYKEVGETMGISNRIVEYRIKKTQEQFKEKLHFYYN